MTAPKTGTTRRDLLRQASVFTAVAAGFSFRPFLRPAGAQTATPAFPHGVASGDPAPDGAILWTRVNTASDGDVPLVVQVAETADFARVILEEAAPARAADDHTTRVRVTGLSPDRWYHYRFLTPEGAASRTGRTRTAPAPGSLSPLRLVLASCQNYEQGWYGAWARLLADDAAAEGDGIADAVLHLGDFIYETTPDLPDGMRPARRLPPLPDGLVLPGGRVAARSVADYRHLYRAYLSDPALQAARARWPFICTWDDHEFSNDCWQSYETYTSPGHPAMTRKVAANRVWTEYVPARLDPPAHPFRPAQVEDTPGGAPDDAFLIDNPDNRAALDTLTIYRSLAWGDTAEIIVTDARSYRSPQPMDAALEEALGAPAPPVDIVRILDQGRTANGGHPPRSFTAADGSEVPNPRADSPPGTVLGARQKAWFKDRLAASPARWKLWANSIPAMPLRLDLSSIPFRDLPDVAVGIDAWNGYPGELRELMGHVRDNAISGVVSCTGDYHMSAAAVLTDDPDADDPMPVALEFATPGISSVSMFKGAEQITRDPDNAFRPLVADRPEQGPPREIFNLSLLGGVRAALAYDMTGMDMLAGWLSRDDANPYVRYMDSNAHGHVIVTVTPEAISATHVVVADPNSAQADSSPAGVVRRVHLSAPLWKGGEAPALAGPDFTGTPPFPFD